jgi:sRNA-binding carbon storage regulator CsrA
MRFKQFLESVTIPPVEPKVGEKYILIQDLSCILIPDHMIWGGRKTGLDKEIEVQVIEILESTSKVLLKAKNKKGVFRTSIQLFSQSVIEFDKYPAWKKQQDRNWLDSLKENINDIKVGDEYHLIKGINVTVCIRREPRHSWFLDKDEELKIKVIEIDEQTKRVFFSVVSGSPGGTQPSKTLEYSAYVVDFVDAVKTPKEYEKWKKQQDRNWLNSLKESKEEDVKIGSIHHITTRVDVHSHQDGKLLAPGTLGSAEHIKIQITKIDKNKHVFFKIAEASWEASAELEYSAHILDLIDCIKTPQEYAEWKRQQDRDWLNSLKDDEV